MKVLKLIAVLVFITIAGYSQTTPWSGTPAVTPQTRTLNGSPQLRWIWGSYLFSFPDTLATKINFRDTLSTGKISTKSQLLAAIAAATPTISGFTVLQQPSVGTVIAPGTSIDATFKQLFAPPQNPTASLTPTTTILELVNATTTPTETGNFTYTYGKNAGTSNIATAAINGSQSGIIQNPNGTSGSITKTWNVNTTTTYTLLVTTIDSKTAQSVATVLYQPKIYVGTCAGTTPTQAEVLAATTKTFATSRAYNMNFTFTGSNLHVFYAYPATFGTVTSVKDAAGNQAINAETLSSLSLTNDRGYVQTYNTATTNNTYSNANIVLSFL